MRCRVVTCAKNCDRQAVSSLCEVCNAPYCSEKCRAKEEFLHRAVVCAPTFRGRLQKFVALCRKSNKPGRIDGHVIGDTLRNASPFTDSHVPCLRVCVLRECIHCVVCQQECTADESELEFYLTIQFKRCTACRESGQVMCWTTFGPRTECKQENEKRFFAFLWCMKMMKKPVTMERFLRLVHAKVMCHGRE